jgi:hypothetical protein
MKGLISMATVLLCGAGVALGDWPAKCVDPCYPERYNFMARQVTNAAFAPQVQNGHVLDQTVWNYYFEPGSDKLTTGGLERLAYLVRRRPSPDTVLYLQTAQDVVYDQTAPEKLVETRQTLDGRRIAAVQAYLTAQTAGRPAHFQILVHDPAEVNLAATPVNASVSQMYMRFTAGLTGGGMGGMGGMGMGGMGGGMGGMGMGGMGGGTSGGTNAGSTGGANVTGGSGSGGAGTGTGP